MNGPQTQRSRPAGNGPANTSLTNDSTVPAQLRRRRNASRRMQTLDLDLRRDPIDPRPDDKRPVILCKIGQRSAYFTSDINAVIAACKGTDTPFMRTVQDRDVIAVPVAHVDDVLARLEYGKPRRVVHVTTEDAS